MKAVTKATLATLRESAWFTNVGSGDAETAIVVSSWKQAIDHCTSPEWENLVQEAINRYCEQLAHRSKERYNTWNTVSAKLDSVVNELVAEKVSPVTIENELRDSFVEAVSCDIFHLCMEAEFSDVHPPGFFASQGYWYCSGHFPCGWKGKFPDGQMIIY